MKARQHARGQPEGETVDHQQEDAQREDRDRQREYDQHRAYHGVEQAQHQRGDQGRAEVLDAHR